jgi:sec-independent protein translocase protein TatA
MTWDATAWAAAAGPLAFIGMNEMLIIGGIIVLIFGGSKLPQLARGMGEGIREFKNSVGGADEAVAAVKAPPAAAATAPVAAAVPAEVAVPVAAPVAVAVLPPAAGETDGAA